DPVRGEVEATGGEKSIRDPDPRSDAGSRARADRARAGVAGDYADLSALWPAASAVQHVLAARSGRDDRIAAREHAHAGAGAGGGDHRELRGVLVVRPMVRRNERCEL